MAETLKLAVVRELLEAVDSGVGSHAGNSEPPIVERINTVCTNAL